MKGLGLIVGFAASLCTARIVWCCSLLSKARKREAVDPVDVGMNATDGWVVCCCMGNAGSDDDTIGIRSGGVAGKNFGWVGFWRGICNAQEAI